MSGQEITAVVELLNFHAQHGIRSAIEARRAAKAVWVGRVPSPTARLLSRLDEKAAAYREIVSRRQLPYVIAVFASVESFLAPRDLEAALLDSSADWFNANETVSGVLHFEETSGSYVFTYFPNPRSRVPLLIPNGTLFESAV
jgi:hypothetical protein